ncbi:Type 4 prepilin-like proteins leader peptide-processing enzyme [compost metagenome]
MIDFDTHYTYSYITYSGIAIGAIFMLIERFYLNQAITTYLIGLGIGVLVIGAIVFLTRGMGEGDIEIAALCGIFIGWQNTLAMLLLSFVLGALYGITLIIFRQKSRKDEIAFVPFLAMGSIIAIFWGNRLISIYSGLFF